MRLKPMFSKLFKLTLIVACATQACLAKKQKKLEPIAPPYIDTDLAEHHFKLPRYEQILGYKNDEYVLVYGHETVWLYDMNGKEYKEWNTNIKRAQLLKNCNLLVIDNHENNNISEKNYAGDIIWSKEMPGRTHHDFEVTDDGHITLYYNIPMPEDFELTNNCKHDEMLTDVIVEIDKDGNRYFEWPFYKHYGKVMNNTICSEHSLERQQKSNFSKLLDPIHPNGLDVLQDNKWYRMGYKEFKPGNIIMTLHHLRRFVILDKETKKIVYLYDGRQDKKGIPLDGPHEAKMIPEGVPGAGNIMIFDNGLHDRKYTIVREINPITKETVWEYKKPGEFFSKFAGSWQRLKNGDTFISDDSSGRAIIVNRAGDILWQFVRPEEVDDPWVKRARLYPRSEFGHCLN